MPKLKHHVFICTNEREPGSPRGCCSSRGAMAVRERFKEEVGKRKLKGIVRANQAGCLDQCAYGPVIVVYPEGVWYGCVTPDDVTEIFNQHLDRGEVVQRLVIPERHLNTPAAAMGPKPEA